MNLAVYRNGFSVDCVIKRDVYPQKMHLCSKNISGVSVFVLKISVVYQIYIFDVEIIMDNAQRLKGKTISLTMIYRNTGSPIKTMANI